MGTEEDSLKLEVSAKLPIITTNLKKIEEILDKNLVKYNVVVTEENLASSKAKATELNKLSTNIDDYRKSKSKELSAPITKFQSECKTLYNKCENAKKALKTQIKSIR